MKARFIFLLCTLFSVYSCIVSKVDRQLKRSTKAWRQSELVLESYADSPLAGDFIVCRENGKFEYTTSGMFKSFRAGNWTYVNDTILLNFSDVRNENNALEKYLMNTDKTTLSRLQGDTISWFKMKLMHISEEYFNQN